MEFIISFWIILVIFEVKKISLAPEVISWFEYDSKENLILRSEVQFSQIQQSRSVGVRLPKLDRIGRGPLGFPH